MKPSALSMGLVLVRNTILSRWMVVVAGFFIMSVSGAIYAFGVYSGALKTALGYNQKTLNTVGFFKDFGNIGILAGLIADLCPAWVVLSIGVAFNTVGYLMIWLSVTKKVIKPALWQVYLYITIGGNSVAFTHAGALVTCVKDFPLHRGMIVGLLKGFLGLSTAILTLIYHAIYGDQPKSFILLITYLPLVVIFSFMFFIRPMPVPAAQSGAPKAEKRFFYKLLAFELLTAAYLMVVILVQHTVGVGHAVNVAFGILLLAIFLIPVALVASVEYKALKKSRASDVEMSPVKNPISTENPNAKNPNPAEDTTNAASARILPRQDDSSPDASAIAAPQTQQQSKIAKLFATPPLGHDFTIWQALVHPEFWLLSIASTAGFGAGLMLIDNLGQVGASFGYDTEQTSTFVSLISIWNCLGRVGAGFISEFFLERRGIARPFFFAASLLLSAAGYLAIALALPGALFIGSIVIGLCYGAQWSLLHIIVSEVFGLKYYGTLQSIIAMASPLGTFLLSVRVAGYLYDREADHQRARLLASGAKVVGELSCKGTVCYKTCFFIMAAVCVFGTFLMLVMSFRTMRFYRHDVYEKLKAAKIANEQLEQKQED